MSINKSSNSFSKKYFSSIRNNSTCLSDWAGTQKKIHVSGTTTLIILKKETNDIMKIVQSLKDYNILLKGVTKIIRNERKEQKKGFFGMLLGTLGARNC